MMGPIAYGKSSSFSTVMTRDEAAIINKSEPISGNLHHSQSSALSKKIWNRC